MAVQSAPNSFRSLAIASRITPDRRRHKRVAVTLLGRFMRANKQEYPCKLYDISVGGCALMAPVEVESNEKIVAYFDHIGGIEGHVVRTFDGFQSEQDGRESS